MSKKLAILGIFIVIGLTLGGIAFAVIPDSAGVIHGCYGKSNGQLRVIDEGQACKNNETPLDWSQQGPPGEKGDTGPGLSTLYVASSPANVSPGERRVHFASCNPGDFALSGGWSGDFSDLTAFMPFLDVPSSVGADAWQVGVINTSAETRTVTVFVRCTDMIP
jgi:hypothetical protein